jgi:hypothetical protein
MRSRLVVAVALLTSAACGGKHRLSQYQFADRTLALVYVEPLSPQLLHDSYDVSLRRDPLEAVVRAGVGVAKEREARRASARLDSAIQKVDVSNLLAQRTVERASRYLGTRASMTPETADYLLEVAMRSFGIDARGSEAAYLYTRAEAVLLDRRTGREIWSVTVNGRERMTPQVQGARGIPGAIITTSTIGTVSVADFQAALEQLVTYSSNLITRELREKLNDVRD